MLEVKNLTVYYDAALCLDGVNLEVKNKEVVVVLGPNGAGKTTLLRAISGLLNETGILGERKTRVSGVIAFNGNKIENYKAWDIVKLGIIHCPERQKVFQDMTVLENSRIGAYIRQDKAETAKDLEKVLQLFPILNERRDQLAGTLSGGERQMLAIARALVMKPKLLLLDEPSLGLAPIVKENVFKYLEIIKNNYGVTILLVEQDASLALDLADRAYILVCGRIVGEGTKKELMEKRAIIDAYLGI